MNHRCGPEFEAESAGFEPTEINPLAVEAMKETGIDISGNRTKSVFDFFKQGRLYSFVITVCDESTAKHALYFRELREAPLVFRRSIRFHGQS